MKDTIIAVENLSKRYLIGHESSQRERYHSLRDSAMRTAKNLARKTLEMVRGEQVVQGDEVEEFWALKDVSFEIKQGEVLGIVGRNGAGKSTLLKILSRITEPSHGRVTLDGRVASLLEVGTGFHPELTGRENIFLNGAILGMTKREIAGKFDEIVAFAEVERFLDTPVKRYSSGMYVRLAFAVAAHLEPEILVVDEVLAVGDAEFQKKCLGKMKDVAGQGRTVLFVSHNMTAISSMCDTGLLLEAGRVAEQGDLSKVVEAYLGNSCVARTTLWKGRLGDDHVEVLSARVSNMKNEILTTDQAIDIEMEIRVHRPVSGLVAAWEIRNHNEQLIAYSAFDDLLPPPGVSTNAGVYTLRMQIPPDTLAAGIYSASLELGIYNNRRIVPERKIRLDLNIENTCGLGRRYLSNYWNNIFRPNWQWTTEKSECA